MKVLIACEYSGTVRDAFRARGHDAWSCDLLQSEGCNDYHIQGDVLNELHSGWDLMIGHPPCQYLSYAGTEFWNDPGRLKKRLEALNFFGKLWEAPIERICLENPKSCASPVIAKYSQEIQPYYWGEPMVKTTWLWLKNLPKLTWQAQDDLFSQKTAVKQPRKQYFKSGRPKDCLHIIDKGVPRKERSKERARFWPGIAQAMAEQWGA